VQNRIRPGSGAKSQVAVLSGKFNFAGSLQLRIDIYETPFLWRFLDRGVYRFPATFEGGEGRAIPTWQRQHH